SPPKTCAPSRPRRPSRRPRSRTWLPVPTWFDLTDRWLQDEPNSRRPVPHLGDVHGEARAVWRLLAVLRVLLGEQRQGPLALRAVVEDPRAAAQADPPQPAPFLLVVVDEDRDLGPGPRVLDPAQRPRALRLAVDRGVERVAVEHEHDRDGRRPPVGIGRREPRHARGG